jgi:S-formylglutathione hydrolase FrmB
VRLLSRGLSVLTLGLLLCAPALAARIDTVQVHSPSMQKAVAALVVVPEAASTTERVPTLYLLHGHGGNHLDWQQHVDLRPLADAYNVLIVCPDGSPDGWYLDSPLDPTSQYETFLAEELPAWIDARYPTHSDRAARAIAGLSMGGHGALLLAFHHPNVYSAASSMSGGVDLTHSTQRWGIANRLGAYDEYPARWHAHSIVTLAEHVSPPDDLALLIDCGVDDLFLPDNRRLHAILLQRGIAHDYVERPGGHSWAYWTRVLPYHLLFFQEAFARGQD